MKPIDAKIQQIALAPRLPLKLASTRKQKSNFFFSFFFQQVEINSGVKRLSWTLLENNVLSKITFFFPQRFSKSLLNVLQVEWCWIQNILRCPIYKGLSLQKALKKEKKRDMHILKWHRTRGETRKKTFSSTFSIAKLLESSSSAAVKE